MPSLGNKYRQGETLGPFIGIDVGQKHDPTAIAVAEVEVRKPVGGAAESPEVHYLVRYLNRLPLGTPYPEVSRRLVALYHRIERQARRAPELFVDATGVGTAVVDLLRQELPSSARVWAVTFVPGLKRRVHPGPPLKVSLGKGCFVSRLQGILQSGRLHLPQGSESKALIREMLDYEIRVSNSKTLRYASFRFDSHDDLVTALGLTIQPDLEIRG